MTVRHQRGAALLIGGALALIFTAIAAVQIAAWTVGSVERTSHQVIPGPVHELSIDAAAGEVTVVPTSADEVRIDSTVKGALHTPRWRAVKHGAAVRLDGSCPVLGFGPCNASIVVHAPAETAVNVRSGTGDLTASGITGPVRLETGSGDVNGDGLSGDVDLRTSSGDVNVRGLSGPTALKTGSGDVNAAELRARTVQAVSSSGDVELEFRAAPDDVDSATASGDVNVVLPPPLAYRVEADTGSGDREVGVDEDSSSPRVVRARTSSGDVIVAYGK